MKTSTFLAMAALTLSPLQGQELQQIADSLPLEPLQPGATKLTLPRAPGVKVELLGSDYEQLIGKDGKITPVLSETPVLVSFRVSRKGESVVSRDYPLQLSPATPAGGNAKPAVIPEILQWKGGTGHYTIGNTISVKGQSGVAKELAADLQDDFGREFALLREGKGSIHLSYVRAEKLPYGKEAYRMTVTPEGVTIQASHPTGMYWGTRTLLQILRQTGGTLPCGEAVDFPRYRLRGFMLDIARTPYPLSYLRKIVKTMAWYKMNDLHLVINNNFIFHEIYVDQGRDPFRESYTAFRLESNMKGKDGTPLTASDLSYTKKEFADFIRYAEAHGVHIVPEIDTPGHALSFTRVRPDLIYKGPMHNEKRRCEMLDAANPATVHFVGKVFDEYLLPDQKLGQPVFQNCVVHVGSDEFFGEKEDYRQYADGILKHVLRRGYTPRIWGSLSSKPGKTPVVSKGVQMNLWNGGWMKAWEAVQQGFDVINTNDALLYIVPYANYYRMDKNHRYLYEKWIPNQVGPELLPAGHPQLLGATFAVWNDMTDLKHSGYAPIDIWGIIEGSMDVLSQKMWGKASAPDSFDQHRKLVSRIGKAPRTNPLYQWKNAAPLTVTPEKLPLKLNRPALGPNYHLTMEVELEAAPAGEEQVLLSGPEGELLAVTKDGSIGFRRDDSLEFSFDAKLPIGKKVKIELIGKPEHTTLLLDGTEVEKLTLTSFRSDEEHFEHRTQGLRSTFVLPLETAGRHLRGKIYSLRVEPQSSASPSPEKS